MEQRDWMVPRFFDPEKRKVLLSIHTYVIRTKHHTILFDTCCGNHKERGGVYPFHMVDTPYLENLAAMGCKPEDIDYVMCSHLHADHIGWNTRLQDGKWVPTFPNAKYLISRDEPTYWEAAVKNRKEISFGITAYQDSVAPVIAAGQVAVVDAKDGASLLGDEFQFYPLLGHTPGHTGLFVESGNSRALLTADALHSPIQFMHPEWGTSGDRDRKVAEHPQAHHPDVHRQRHPADDRTFSGAIGGPPDLRWRRSRVSLRLGSAAHSSVAGHWRRAGSIRT